MARFNELSARMQKALDGLLPDCPTFANKPWVEGPPLSARRVAMISSAGFMRRGGKPLVGGDADYRAIPADIAPGDLLISHVSQNFDRTGFQQDINVMLPLDRLREMAADGEIGSLADTHYSFMGSTPPEKMEPDARRLAADLKADNVDAVLLLPV